MTNCLLAIDGENFLHKIEGILKEESFSHRKRDLSLINLSLLFKKPLQSYKILRKIFYASRLHFHPESESKSEELIGLQRKLRNSLIKQGYEFVIAGNVRAQKINNKVIFREKGEMLKSLSI